MTTVVVVGASMAGLRATQALRAAGYDGDLVVIGDEPHPPYYRPPLSKEFLVGGGDTADLALVNPDSLAGLGARWHYGRTAVELDVDRRRVRLDTNDEVEWDGVVIATGARARRLPFGHGLAGVQVLRTIDDARELRRRLKPGTRLVVIGAGFIGAEVAAAASALGAEVTVIEVDHEPFARQLGPLSATTLREVHSEQGVRFLTGVPVGHIARKGNAIAVQMADGRVLDADVVVVGVGATPNTEWLATSPVACDNGVVTDETGRANVDRVVAAGDVARYRSRLHRGHARVEHWTNARDMPVTAARALLADIGEIEPAGVPAYDPQPYVWSEQYEHRIQLAGRLDPQATVTVVDGSVEDRRFIAIHQRRGKLQAVMAWNHPKLFRQLRHELNAESDSDRRENKTPRRNVD